MKKDVYQTITDQIVEQLEQGVRPWVKPWSAEHLAGRVSLPLRHNGQPYRGVNVIALWMQGLAKGYAAPRWMTFKQAISLGGCVRKGERGSLTVFADTIRRQDTDTASSEETERVIPFMKGYTVFNVEQIDGLPEAYTTPPAARREPLARIGTAEAYFRATGVRLVHEGTRACNAESRDTVTLPPLDCFRDAESYYAALAHETVHWTKHERRLARDLGRKRWGDQGYAMEELVAELGAAFVCAGLDLTPALRASHASYIANWLQVLKDDKRAIFTAAGLAQRATDYLNAFSAPSAEAAA